MHLRRCYAFSVLSCAVAAVEGDTLYQIGYAHGISYVGMLLLNTHMQGRPDLLLPGDIVATAVAHKVEVSCTISALAESMLVTPQQLRCAQFCFGKHRDNHFKLMLPSPEHQTHSLLRWAMILYYVPA
jgi:hypothetical protein